MEYISLKLITGEIVVGKVDTICEEFVTIENPVQLSYGYDFDGNMGIKYMPYMPFSDTNLFTFSRKYIIVQGNLSKNIQDYYLGFISNEQKEQDLVFDNTTLH